MLNLTPLLEALGQLTEEEFDHLVKTERDRRKMAKAVNLLPGTRIVLNNKTRPLRMIGLKGEIVQKRGAKFDVLLDGRVSTVRVPVDLMTVLTNG